ncbi:hypothetical protein ACFQ7F_28740 [Streptomyces sp. NPDC056486]|uniref:hypothetical protein n=1 Tax=Streptomyces sp. NPDC056486 TaxID=3345835 RepID=UPI0036C1C27C
MNTPTSQSTHMAQETGAADRTRLWSVLSAVLFLPAALAVGALAFSSDQAGRCLTYGEQCGSSLPEWLFVLCLGMGGATFLVALVASSVRVRRMALGVQLSAESMALMVILSHM